MTSLAIERASPADYADRKGYDVTFLGARIRIDLPTKTKRPRDLLTFEDTDRRRSELKYMHFTEEGPVITEMRIRSSRACSSA
jgi:hypothetical protein